ncbi:ATP-grasp fold amidoligase family protein [Nesterenkonia sandarakina]|uniref:Teichuronopeptide biosynthesis TupA-like protein n=1 Tax=Nesterenkonia sandarakina TaxID=272918 RepID=A0A2T0YTC9_9MICC|nr:ATP-grasp fold amidoligase family protein [Nesterenkonia sandarakina]PRZ18831.1 teichuronopeptide biosynthesis TupA-like protein [Nesterenkonia sandarakina]
MHTSFRRLLGPVPDPLLRRIMYRRRFGRWGNFETPSRFTEFLSKRMLEDRSPEIAWTCDKRAMKDYAAERAPWINVPETLWHGTDLDELDLSTLPDHWVIKPNHRCKAVHFGDRSTTIEELRRVTRGWLRPYDRIAVGEWAYTQARRELIVEPRIGNGRPLIDFKTYVFCGRMRILHTDAGRFTEDFHELFYTREWEPLDLINEAPRGPVAPRPKNFDQMVRAAEALGARYDFMRVDLYNLDGELWFGELTPYPSGGMDPFTPDSADFQLGAWWAGRDTAQECPDGLPRLMDAAADSASRSIRKDAVASEDTVGPEITLGSENLALEDLVELNSTVVLQDALARTDTIVIEPPTERAVLAAAERLRRQAQNEESLP